jgi:sterol desaturase/sphingolipid hydroxylase (fatty acid hydroxylase superfamily)
LVVPPRTLLTENLIETVDRWDGTLLGPSAANKRVESVSVFRSEWFEKHFATAHAAMPGIWWGPVVVGALYLASRDVRFSWLSCTGTFVAGFVLWTLLEYVLHRFWMHHPPSEDFDSKLKAFMVHGYHHEFPNDRMRLVAPLILSAPIALIIAVVYVSLLGRYFGTVLFAGTLLGYLAYDWVHYYTHHFRPTTRLGKFLRRYHMEHHYRDSESHYGISSPLWDWVFGTATSKVKRAVQADQHLLDAELLAAESRVEKQFQKADKHTA